MQVYLYSPLDGKESHCKEIQLASIEFFEVVRVCLAACRSVL